MTSAQFVKWLRQPTTITGLATAAGAGAVAVMQFSAHDANASAAVGAAVFAFVHVFINDNTVATDAATLASNLIRVRQSPEQGSGKS